MSSTAAPTDLASLNFTGGFPTSKDLAPSIVFLVIYILLVPVFLWRIISPKHRGLILIRPGIFITCRIAMLVLRAIMSKNTYGEGELIGQLILVSVGYLFLLEPLVEMWRRHVATAVHKDHAPRWVNRISRYVVLFKLACVRLAVALPTLRANLSLLKVALLAAVGCSIAGASSISSALDDPSQMDTVRNLRKAAAVLSLAVAVIALGAIIATHVTFGLDARRTLFLIPVDLCLIIVSVYRLVQTFSTSSTDRIRSPAAFWVLQMVFELLACAAMLSISIPQWYPKPPKEAPVEDDVELGSRK